jgi:hypothetical protein
MQAASVSSVIRHMKKVIIVIAFTLVVSIPTFAQQDKTAKKLADKMAAAFSNGKLDELDLVNLLHGRRLKLSTQNWITDVGQKEFESRTFKNFWAMERWMEQEEADHPGFPVRTSGENISCRKGLCRLDLVDNQMAHNHVYLTHVWYGYQKGKIYVKRIRILYG